MTGKHPISESKAVIQNDADFTDCVIREYPMKTNNEHVKSLRARRKAAGLTTRGFKNRPNVLKVYPRLEHDLIKEVPYLE